MPRFIVVGAGAVGGVMGARFFEHGHDVVLVARGAHYRAIERNGLLFSTPERSIRLRIPVVDDPAKLQWTGNDIAILAVKSQDSVAALRRLSIVAPESLPVLCAQNGVENERVALRCFSNVYGAEVSCFASYRAAGTVVAHGSPVTGVLVMGRYPSTTDDTVTRMASAFRDATWIVRSTEKVMAWKYAKLLRNLTNAVAAICGTEVRSGALVDRARSEAEAALTAAGIEWVRDVEWNAEGGRDGVELFQPVGEATVPGGSSWQSLDRGAGTIESAYLNGEIALLGRLHGVPTPVNALLSRLANDAAERHLSPGAINETQVLALLDELE